LGAALAGAAVALTPSLSHALDLPKLLGKQLMLDVTEVTIVAQRFDSREVDPITEGGAWGQWINRLNVKLDWNHFTVGVRLDSGVYWNTLAEQCGTPLPNGMFPANKTIPSGAGTLTCASQYPNIARDDLTRYQNSIYPAKIWANYKDHGIDVTVGDAYVQFARGLVLSMRKQDDLGIDNTIRGVKASVTKGPFAVTVLAGMANPSRVDEATGEALFVAKRVTDMTSPVYSPRLEQPVFGADQIFGAELQAGREKPVVLTTSMSYINRCAPYKYETGAAAGRIIYNADVGSTLFGACDDVNVTNWLSSPGIATVGTDRGARHVATVAQAIEFPKMGKFGSLYIVGAYQHQDGIGPSDVTTYDSGTALYATYTNTINKNVQNTFEFKDYRNFYPTSGSINATQVTAFSPIAWSAVPTIESLTQDNMLGNFNVCVDGVRERTDVRLNKHLLLFGQAIFTLSKGEQGLTCDKNGNLTVPSSAQPAGTDYVADGLVGWQSDFRLAGRETIFNGTVGARQDYLGTGDTFIQQFELTYTFSHKLGPRTAIEFIGRHRVRYEKEDNVGPLGTAERWVEGEHYTGVNIAPKWIFTQGIEYSTRDLAQSTTFAGINGYPPWLYLNLGGTYKFTKDSNLRLFVGQQRGGLKCISGICRVFPAFEGARMELTVRF